MFIGKNHRFLLMAVAASVTLTGAAHAAPTFNVFVNPTDVINGVTVGSIKAVSIDDSNTLTFASGAATGTPAGVANEWGGSLGNISLIASATTTALPDQPAGYVVHSFTSQSFDATSDSYFGTVVEKNAALNTTMTSIAQVNRSTGVVTTVIRGGTNAVPGVASGFTDNNSFLVNSSNNLVAEGTLATNAGGVTSLNNNVILGGTPGNLTALVRQGTQVPGLATGTQWAYPTTGAPVVMNNQNQFATQWTTQNFIGALQSTVVFIGNTNGSMKVIAQTGDAAPGGGTYNAVSITGSTPTIKMSSDGYVAFAPTIQQDDGSLIGTLCVANTVGAVRWMSTGDAIPGHPAAMVATQSFVPTSIISGGRVLTTVKDVAGNSYALFGAAGDVHTIAEVGDAVAGLPASDTFSAVSTLEANDLGQVILTATLQGADVMTSNDMVWLAYTPDAGLQLLFREGGTLSDGTSTYNVGSSSSVVISTTSLNNNGIFAFADAGRGFEVNLNNLAAVPEPASLAFVGAGLVGLIGRRRNRKC